MQWLSLLAILGAVALRRRVPETAVGCLISSGLLISLWGLSVAYGNAPDWLSLALPVPRATSLYRSPTWNDLALSALFLPPLLASVVARIRKRPLDGGTLGLTPDDRPI